MLVICTANNSVEYDIKSLQLPRALLDMDRDSYGNIKIIHLLEDEEPPASRGVVQTDEQDGGVAACDKQVDADVVQDLQHHAGSGHHEERVV